MNGSPIYIEVDGLEVKLWEPSPCNEGYTISDCGGWLDGIYDSCESAILGFKLSISGGEGEENGYSRLRALASRVCRTEKRMITVSDFNPK